MPDISALETNEKLCRTAADFTALALEAAKDSSGMNYASKLLEKAEAICQMPLDYIKTAEGYALILDDKEHALELYEETEENCFEASEFAELGKSICIALKDKEKAKEIFESAISEAKNPKDFFYILGCINDSIGESELAGEIINKIESQCKTAQDYYNLAEILLREQNNKAGSVAIFKKAEKFINNIRDTLNYVEGISKYYDDKTWIEEVLENAESDAQFTADFLLLAEGYKKFAGNDDKAEEMLDSAKDYAMKYDELTALADTYINLFNDMINAAAAYQKAIKDIPTLEILLETGNKIKTELKDDELAGKYFSAGLAKCKSVKDYRLLAVSAKNSGNMALAGESYAQAVSILTEPEDFIAIAGGIAEDLGDMNFSRQTYNKAYEKIDNFKMLMEFLDEIKTKLNDREFINDIIKRAEEFASSSADFLTLANASAGYVYNSDSIRNFLLNAEDRVSSLDDLKAANDFVKLNFPDDEEWLNRLEIKTQKRIENSAKYDELQKRENNATTFNALLELVSDIMDELNDVFYAKKLLSRAENLLNQETYNFTLYKKLMLFIDDYLKESEWVINILDFIAAKRINFFSDLSDICDFIAVHFNSNGSSRALIGKYIRNYYEKMKNNEKSSIYDFIKLTEVVFYYLEDKPFALEIIKNSETKPHSGLTSIYIAAIYEKAGDTQAGINLLHDALNSCTNIDEVFNLTRMMKRLNFDERLIYDIYGMAKDKFTLPKDLIKWAEGYVDILEDYTRADKAYKIIYKDMISKKDKEELNYSMNQKITREYI